MRLAHVREHNAAAGADWRLAAALDSGGSRWVDLEIARRRAVAANSNLAHDSALHRQPVTTLDDHLGRGLRVAALADLVEAFVPRDDDDAVLDAGDLAFGPPILRPPSFRDFYAFERHVRTMWERRDQTIPEAWYRLPIFYFSNVSELRGPGDPVWAPRGSSELDYELEVGALIDTPAMDLPAERGEEAIGGYFVLNDWSARDLQRDESTLRLGPAKGKDFGVSIGPWLVTPDELADRRAAGGDRAGPRDGGDGPDARRPRRRDDPRDLVERPLRVRADGRPRLGRRAPAPGRAPRQRDRRRRVPARDPRRDAGPVPGAGRRGHPRDRAAGPAGDAGGRPAVVSAIDESAAAG